MFVMCFVLFFLQKIKRKIGRKLPPAQNATNTEIKSKGNDISVFGLHIELLFVELNPEGVRLKFWPLSCLFESLIDIYIHVAPKSLLQILVLD